jgi:hypothetical protein
MESTTGAELRWLEKHRLDPAETAMYFYVLSTAAGRREFTMQADEMRLGLAHCSEARFTYLMRRLVKVGLLKTKAGFGSTIWTVVDAPPMCVPKAITTGKWNIPNRWNIPNSTARRQVSRARLRLVKPAGVKPAGAGERDHA